MANATESSLMRRTKAELVNIILRKDAVEKEQKTQLENLEVEVKNLRSADNTTKQTLIREKNQLSDRVNDLVKKLSAKSDEYEKLKNDFVNTCDRYADDLCNANIKIKRWKYITVICVIAVATLAIIASI